MCGIAGFHRRTAGPVRRADRLAANLLLQIENRGRHSTGTLTITDRGKVAIRKRVMPAREFVREHRVVVGNPRTVLLHTRFATVGTVNVRNAHPVVNGALAAVHNGTIWNHGEVFAEIGRKRNASVDSEVIPAVVAHHGWDQAEKALARLEGGMATAIVDRKRPGEVLLARLSGYPLHVLVTPSLVVWASTREAIERAWKATYGSSRPNGDWIDMADRTVLRVNGRVEKGAIPGAPAARRPAARPKAKARPVVLPQRATRPAPSWQQTVYGGRTDDDLWSLSGPLDDETIDRLLRDA
jgi:glucosamine 6-phosphate synthetase-like amidotransferase/phosphosugar isomerase protein